MKYYRNAEVARLYNVSEKSVRNWIASAQSGKIKLELLKDGGKTFIADSLYNESMLEKFTLRAKKFRNSSTYVKLCPTDNFYTLFSEAQIFDILINLENYHELPEQYKHIGQGGIYWSKYLHKLYASPKHNILTNTIRLLHSNYDYITSLVQDQLYINVVDLGVGNGLAVKNLLAALLKDGKLKKYVGVDISPELLSITQHNIKRWLSGTLPTDGYVKDLTYERFGEAIRKDSYGADAHQTANIVLLLGGTLKNFRHPEQALHTIKDSLSQNDILITSLKLDTEDSRKFFDFHIDGDGDEIMSIFDRTCVDLLGIDPKYYEVEQIFDQIRYERQVKIRFKLDITLDFNLSNYKKSLHFEKGDRILVWRSHHYSSSQIISLFENRGFRLLQASVSPDEKVLLLISKVNADPTTA